MNDACSLERRLQRLEPGALDCSTQVVNPVRGFTISRATAPQPGESRASTPQERRLT
jgi:hypothetical protein